VQPDEINAYLTSVDSTPAVQKTRLHNIVLRPQASIMGMAAALPELGAFLRPYAQEFVELAEINMKYDGYIQKEREMVEKVARLENLQLGEAVDYHAIGALSMEARTKLSKLKPRTLGQASRISGVSPADVSVLLVHMGR
jgi:tRNA uridine 5-carboxymethylaminomethyl modification enzyme